MTPQVYSQILIEYDLILARVRDGYAFLNELPDLDKERPYAKTILSKIVRHAISLRKISPSIESTGASEAWDVGAICAVARALIEAFDAFSYVVLQQVWPNERGARLLVWELHGKERRAEMLRQIGADGLDIQTVRSDVTLLREMLTSHSWYSNLPKKCQKDIADGKTTAFFKTKNERCLAAGINHDFYITVTMFLSQYVHTHPFALSQLSLSDTGDANALQVAAMPLQYSMSFLAKLAEGIESAWPGARRPMSLDQRNILGQWCLLAEQGVKGPWK